MRNQTVRPLPSPFTPQSRGSVVLSRIGIRPAGRKSSLTYAPSVSRTDYVGYRNDPVAHKLPALRRRGERIGREPVHRLEIVVAGFTTNPTSVASEALG